MAEVYQILITKEARETLEVANAKTKRTIKALASSAIIAYFKENTPEGN